MENKLMILENVSKCHNGLKSRLGKQSVTQGTEESTQEDAFCVQFTELTVTENFLDTDYRHVEREPQKLISTRTISFENIFMSHTKNGDLVRTVLTKGVAGIGKTMLTKKFTLDWAQGRTNQDIQLLFPFTFKQLTALCHTYSLVELLHHLFSESVGICSLEHLRVLFIFDGLDERKLPLDFSHTRVLTESTKTASVDELLVNLIRGNLLPSARLWITTRPAAASQIPAECVSMVTEVQGFSDVQKELYFRKMFKDEQQATAVISHVRTFYSLHSLSHIPGVCWLISTVLLDVMETKGLEQLPRTLTQICIHLLLIQKKKYKHEGCTAADPFWTQRTWLSVNFLGYLAFEHHQKGKSVFYESDQSLNYAVELNMLSETFSVIFKQERVPAYSHFLDQVFFFIPCFQEFLAALYIHLSFINKTFDLLTKKQASLIERIFKRKPKLKSLLHSAVDQILLSPDKNTALIQHFVLGLSLPANQCLLQGLLTQTGSNFLASQETMQYLNKKLIKCLAIEGRLLFGLSEMIDQSVLEEVQRRMGDTYRSINTSPAHWSALVFLILSSDQEELYLKKFCPSEAALLNLIPFIKAYTKATLSHCNLSHKSCGPLSTVLFSSSLRHLDLSNNNLQDLGVKKLFAGLTSSPCGLERLILSHCSLSQTSCGPLSSVLTSSHLIHLDVSNNELQDSGVTLLCSGLKNTPCRLEVLRMSGCLVSAKGGSMLALAVSSGLSRLREFDLRYNHIGSSVQLLTALCDDPNCLLETVKLDPVGGRWNIPGLGLRKYYCEFSLDPNTIHSKLCLLSHEQRVTYKFEDLDCDYPQHLDRFTGWSQVLSSTGLTGRCYWEAELDIKWGVTIAMSYRSIARTGRGEECEFGNNNQSWCLRNINGQFSVCHNKRVTQIQSSADQKGAGVFFRRVGVYLDTEAGSLSFFEVHDGNLSHLYTFTSMFSEPLFPGFGLGYGLLYYGESVSLVKVTPKADCQKSCLKNRLSFFCPKY